MYSGTRDSRTEWDDGPDQLTVNAPPVVRNITGSDLIEVWDVFLQGETEYVLNFRRTGGQADTKALLFRNPSAAPYWVGRQARILEQTGPTAFNTPPVSDWYAVVVVNDNESDGSYILNIGTCTEPVTLASGVSTPTPAPNGYYRFTQPVVFWSAVGVRGAPTSDWDAQVYAVGSEWVWPQCFAGLLAESTLPAGSVDFVVGDFNHNPLGTYYPRTFQASGIGDAVTEWDDSPDQITVGQAPIERTTGASDVLEIWDVLLTAGVEYDLFFERTGSADTRISMFQSQNGVYWAGRQNRMFDTTNPHTIFTASADDWYAIVVVNENGGAGTYRVGMSVAPTAVNDPAEAGAPAVTALRPVVPNPASGSVQIGFDLARSETVELAILDVTGRVVGKLPSLAWEAGRWRTGWDGRGRDGQRVPAGVYWVEMSAGTRPVGRSKFILLR